MANGVLPPHVNLRQATRLGFLTSAQSVAGPAEWLCLLAAGMAAAAASIFVDFSLRMPGHAILRAVFPIAVGLALVPRHGAGTVMGATALLTALSFRAGGFRGDGLSLGALTSLAATGPLLDWTLRRVKDGRQLYLGFALAGLASNLLAFAVRGGAKALGVAPGSRPLAAWLPHAALTYVGCGVLAGLISAAVLFYARRPRGPASAPTGTPA